jgi:hypothetical protein
VENQVPALCWAIAADAETNTNWVERTMPIFLATKTVKAINTCLEADQGASYRVNLGKVMPHMGDAYRGAEKNPFRKHMGASGIGKSCGRAIWYSFRWFTVPHFEGRILRLFNRGHLEEARFIALLLVIGVTVFQQDAQGKQFRINDAGGHFGGSGDGVGVGIPDLPPDLACLLEFKTHASKSFTKLVKEGVYISKFEHFVQMQVYMRKMGLTVALYGAVNKDNDELYLEIVPIDTINADQFIDRGKQLVFMRDAPKRIHESPGWYECMYCDHKNVCHLGKEPARNCRTCYYATALPDGTWQCGEPRTKGLILSEDAQLAACANYVKL